MMALDHALKAVPFARSNHVDKALALEYIDQDTVARLDHALGRFSRGVNFDSNLPHKSHRRQVVLGKVSAHRLGQLLFFYKLDQANLRRLVAVARLGLVLRNHARSRLQHGRRPHIALRIEELRHADFLAETSCYSCHFLLHSQHAPPFIVQRTASIGWGRSTLSTTAPFLTADG